MSVSMNSVEFFEKFLNYLTDEKDLSDDEIFKLTDDDMKVYYQEYVDLLIAKS